MNVTYGYMGQRKLDSVHIVGLGEAVAEEHSALHEELRRISRVVTANDSITHEELLHLKLEMCFLLSQAMQLSRYEIGRYIDSEVLVPEDLDKVPGYIESTLETRELEAKATAKKLLDEIYK